jgi:hypothetical protein
MIGLIIVSLINYTSDPAHLYEDGKYEKGMVDLLLAGSNVANVANYNERIFQKIYISNMPDRKEVFVLGSSRSMQIRSGLFPGMSFFNHSVSGATLEDYLAFYGAYEQRGFKPSIIVFGLDPWILNANKQSDGWTVHFEEYLYMAKQLSIPYARKYKGTNDNAAKLLELISLKYFRQSFREMLYGQTGVYYPTSDNDCEQGGLLTDGSRVFPPPWGNEAPVDVDLEASAISFAKDNPVFLGNFTEIDEESLNTFTLFIDYLQSKGVLCIFYLPSYHPSAYSILSQSKDYKIILQVENTFRQLARQKDITVLGGYDPANSQSSAEEFFDGMHPKESSVKKAFSALPGIMSKYSATKP